MTRYQVIDCYTGKVLGEYASRRRATNRADALDLQYGAVRYAVVIAGTQQFASRFVVSR